VSRRRVLDKGDEEKGEKVGGEATTDGWRRGESRINESRKYTDQGPFFFFFLLSFCEPSKGWVRQNATTRHNGK